jgi:hypothetical protein
MRCGTVETRSITAMLVPVDCGALAVQKIIWTTGLNLG